MAPFHVVCGGDLLPTSRGFEDPKQAEAHHKEFNSGERSNAPEDAEREPSFVSEFALFNYVQVFCCTSSVFWLSAPLLHIKEAAEPYEYNMWNMQEGRVRGGRGGVIASMGNDLAIS